MIELTGQIHQPKIEYLLFIKDTIGFDLGMCTDTIEVDTNGFFSIKTTPLLSDARIAFSESKVPILIVSRSISQSLDIDYYSNDSIIVSGKQADFIQYKIDQPNYWKNVYQQMADKHPEIAARNNQSLIYHQVQDSITALRIQFLEDYFMDSAIEGQEEFIDNERNELIYANLYYRMSGQPDNLINQLAFYQKNPVEAEHLTYSDKIRLDSEYHFSLYYCKQFIHEFIMSAIRVENPDGNFSSYEFYLENGFKIIDQSFTDEKINSLAKVLFVNELISTARTFKTDLNPSIFNEPINRLSGKAEPSMLIALQKNLEELRASIVRLAPGTQAPKFALKDSLENQFTLKDFEKKVIVFDIWASWCGPCISSFPKWDQLTEKYSNNDNMKFVTVSMDDKKETWLRALGKYDFDGLKLYSDSLGFDSPFAKDYEITSLPMYISIDEDGNIHSVSTQLTDLENKLKDFDL